MQPDSIVPDQTNPQSWNRFSYVLNNPILYSDPSGHEPITIALIVIAVATLILNACAPSPAYESLTPRQAEIQQLIDSEDYQGAIDKAIELYNIDTHGEKQSYSEGILDAGISVPYGGDWNEDGFYVGGHMAVLIGPSAFDSPDELVDTIAHEAVHVEQFQNGNWNKNPGAKDLREVEAYDRVAALKNELETSDSVYNEDKDMRDSNYNNLPPYLKKRVDNRNYLYILPE